MTKKKYKLKKNVKICLFLTILGLLLILLSFIYLSLSSPVDKKDNKEIEVEIKSGMSTKSIANLLKSKGLIKSSDFFVIYSKLNNCKSLKASNYDLQRSMSLTDIFDVMCKGDYKKNSIDITFKEGLRLTDYAKVVAKETNISEEEFINTCNNRTYLKELINKYWFLTDDILNDDIYYPLEGYLYPDTYNFRGLDVTAKEVIETMLNEEDKVLSKYKPLMNSHTVHEYLTLASIAELEGTNSENRKNIVGVFENRLKIGLNLGSDVTSYYGVQKPMSETLSSKDINAINSYNTRSASVKGIPVGPICNPGEESIDASINYTKNDYYYFVADKDKNIYFTKTDSEHNNLIAKLKKEGKWLW